jgi:omega-6 fatty acid desaturase (delta-12 desaturase)
MIFHDCGHNSYTPNKTLNYVIGLLISGFVSHPFFWNYNHNIHHNVNGNIENIYDYPYNETIFHSLLQYKSFSKLKRCIYKSIRTPLVFFTVPLYLKILLTEQFRVIRIMCKTYHYTIPKSYLFLEQFVSTSVLGMVVYTCNIYEILPHFITALCFGFSVTIMVVHNEHTYNPPYVVGNDKWTYKDSGLIGSSFIQIPPVLKYFFHGLEYHHIHHMNAKIPGYNLQKYHDEVVSKSNMFDAVVKLSMLDCYNNLWLVLYDEDKKRYITFSEADEEIMKDKQK